MSAGAFESAIYELDAGNGGGFAPCRVQPETLDLLIAATSNDEGAGPVDLPVSAKASKGIREYGIGMRAVTLEFTDQGDLPDGYTGENVRVPVLTPATFAVYTIGAVGTYLGSPVRVVGRSPERVR